MIRKPHAPLPFLLHRLYGTFGLALLAGFYLFTGLIGHEPWRGDDIRYFGPIHSMLEGEGLLFPQIGGLPFLDYPPFYYWCAALLAFVTGGLLDAHDGARLASAAFTALTVYWVARAAERLYGRPTRTVAALLVLGSLGLVLHAHETQPRIALMAMVALVLASIARVPERPLQGSLQAGLGCALAILAAGFAGLLFTAPLFILAIMISPECRNPRASGGLLAGLTLGACLGGLWPLILHLTSPDLFALWRHEQWRQIVGSDFGSGDFARLAELLGWFLWPLWPLASWALWRERRRLFQLRWLLPLLSTVITLFLLALSADYSPPAMLPLLPALALLAAGGIPTLRRGAANAFDWFSAMNFGAFAILVWIAWTAQVFAWPPGLARHIAHVAPTFTAVDTLPKTLAGLSICLLWFALAWGLPRTPGRGAANWAMGVTMLLCLAVTLLMPWFDHSRSYRPMAQALEQALAPYADECVASNKLSFSIRSMLDYYVGLRPEPDDAAATQCRLLLTHTAGRKAETTDEIEGWTPIWHFRRGGGKQYEALHLYMRRNRD
ncbi:MAG: glycosyltransferase family 39 protein [Azoarcus sp.]|jgi:4-amino-4-deoxy-L-arabinose transferase-like glycosyltransferase|nr:glycosyltransferase family 39 protein [Azoarcus sp.]